MQPIQTQVQIQILTLILIPTLIPTQLSLILAQLVLLGMMLPINAFTAHFQISLSQEIIKTNGNAIVMPHTDLFLTLMVQRHVNYDLPFIDVLF
jgi:hypothetical protein